MAMAPKRVCPGCRRNKADYGALCDACLAKGKGKAKQQGYDKRRGSASKRGYDRHWQKVREQKLDKNPLCECDRCFCMERTRAANTVHHIQPIETHPHLRLVDSNLASMAAFCHEVEEGRAVDYEYLSWESDLKGKGFFKS
jgi:5-methylcytosine-specific restriction enzyme A